MADNKPKVFEPKVFTPKPKFKSEGELVQYLKNSITLKPAEKQKLLDDFRKGG